MKLRYILSILCILFMHVSYAQYTTEWSSPNLGSFGWGGAFGYDIDNDALVEFYTRASEQLTFYNGDYTTAWSFSFPGYDYVSVVQPRDVDGDGMAVPLNMDNDAAGEVVIVGYYYNATNFNYYGRFRVYDATTHVLEYESPEITGFYGSATLEDIDNDSRDELIITRYGSATTSSYVDVYIYSGSAAEENGKSYNVIKTLEAFPNPVKEKVVIPFTVSEHETAQQIKVTIYDEAGREITKLMECNTITQGTFRLIWDGTDKNGCNVSAGNYFIHLEKGGKTESIHINLIK